MYNRRNFIKGAAFTGIGLGLAGTTDLFASGRDEKGKRIGIIGLDTSHSIAFTKEFNNPEAGPELGGFKVVAAYPHGSREIESSYKRIPGYIEQVQKLGVNITDSIEALLKEADLVLLETNDGRLHLEQALQVLKSGKTMFIDKPMTASLKDAIIIFKEAEKRKVPIFSCSSLRFMASAQAVAKGGSGKVTGASVHSPCSLEKTHPDLFWYGIHGVETLFTVMGTGCKFVYRVSNEGTDFAVGTWADDRIGTFRGIRTGKADYGGQVFTDTAVVPLGPFDGYKPLVLEIVKFFQTGIPPVKKEETLEILAFMEAADESKRLGGQKVSIDETMKKALAG
jgi:hypothetical protein